MDRSGNGFLAGPGLADDQERQAVARGLGGNRKRRPEFGSRADQLFEFERAEPASRTPAQARPRRGDDRHWRQALRAAARARPDEPGNRTRRRASPRPRSRRVAMRDHDHRQVGPMLAKSLDQLGPCSASQLPRIAAWTSRPCGPWRSATASSPSAALTTLQPRVRQWLRSVGARRRSRRRAGASVLVLRAFFRLSRIP